MCPDPSGLPPNTFPGSARDCSASSRNSVHLASDSPSERELVIVSKDEEDFTHMALRATTADLIGARRQLRFADQAEGKSAMLGILVHGDNHFIVRGPLPTRDVAMALASHWSIIQIGRMTPPELAQWQITSQEFRENLQWAVVVPGDNEPSPAVKSLLNELAARGIIIHDAT